MHGDEWPPGLWGMRPQVELAFSLEKVPTFGRGSSLAMLLAVGSNAMEKRLQGLV